MKKRKTIIILILLIVSTHDNIRAQGCSDAGVCSIGSSHSITDDSTSIDSSATSSVSLTASLGMGEQGVSIFQIIPELNIGITKKISLQARIPFMAISGNLDDVTGIGDVVMGLSFIANKKSSTNTVIYGGIKIPLSDANKKEKNQSLPMPYQVGIGTLDFIGGISHSFYNWQTTVGYQHVLNNGNKNEFTRSLWAENKDAQKYFESNGFIRGNDASLNVEYNFKIKKVSIAPGVLAIYRINKDQILNTNNVHYAIKGSDGITLNITGDATYEIGKKSTLRFQLGFPVIVRDVRADGLTRSFVLNLGYYINLN